MTDAKARLLQMIADEPHMAEGGTSRVTPLSKRFNLGEAGTFDPIGNAKKTLSGAYDMASKIPANLKALATNPVAYARSLPEPTDEQMMNAFMPGNIGMAGIIKPTGGNWLGGSVEKALKPLRKTGAEERAYMDFVRQQREAGDGYGDWVADKVMKDPSFQKISGIKAANQYLAEKGMKPLQIEPREQAMNDWVDRNLTNYVKKQMATPDDPVRKLAEQGVLHGPMEAGLNRVPENVKQARFNAGMPIEGEGQSELARAWEHLSDASIKPSTVERVATPEPWMKNADPNTSVYALSRDFSASRLGFDHIIDVLNQDLAAGRIRPEQMNKISMEQAVRRTYEFDQDMAKKMRETQAKVTEGMPVHKEYPEGYKWIELTQPKVDPKKELPEGFHLEDTEDGLVVMNDRTGEIASPELAAALKYEGDTMGHCVGGYCPDVVSGRSRIFSLRDAKGEPHVTVEVQPGKDKTGLMTAEELPSDVLDSMKSRNVYDPKFMYRYDEQTGRYLPEMGPFEPRIVQIKGKQNRAPKENYLPFVQDFVKNGAWEEVGDIKNTGLKSLNEAFPRKSDRENFEKLYPNQKYVTADEINIHKTKVDKELIDQYKNWKSKVDLEDPNFKDYEGPEFISNSEYFKRYHPDNTERQANFIRGGMDSPYMIPPEHLGMKDWDTLMREGVFSYDDVSFLTKVMPQRYLTAEDITKAKTRLEESPLSPPEPGMAQGGAVSDAKKRLLDMIAQEPHMAGGGKLKIIGGLAHTKKVKRHGNTVPN